MKISVALMVLALNALASDWTVTGQDDAYPTKSYLIGLGVSEQSAAQASQNAMVEIRKQIRTQVNSKFTNSTSYSNFAGVESTEQQIISEASLSTAGQAEGIQIVHKDQKGKNFYAFAVLNKERYAEIQRNKLEQIADEISGNYESAVSAYGNGEAQLCMSKLDQAYRKLDEADDVMAEYRVMSLGAIFPPQMPSRKKVDDFGVQFLRKLRLDLDSSNSQFRIKASLNGIPLSGLPFALMVGTTRLSEFRTGQNGAADVDLSSPKLEPGFQTLSLIPALGVPGSLSAYARSKNLSWKQWIPSPVQGCSLNLDQDLSLRAKLTKWGVAQDTSKQNLRIIPTISLGSQVQAYGGSNAPKRYQVSLQFTSGDQILTQIDKSVVAKNEREAQKKAIDGLGFNEIRDVLVGLCR